MAVTVGAMVGLAAAVGAGPFAALPGRARPVSAGWTHARPAALRADALFPSPKQPPPVTQTVYLQDPAPPPIIVAPPPPPPPPPPAPPAPAPPAPAPPPASAAPTSPPQPTSAPVPTPPPSQEPGDGGATPCAGCNN